MRFLIALALLSACFDPPPAADPLSETAPAAAQATAAEPPGSGFVVWESNRGGVWRLWIRDLEPAGSGDHRQPRQLSPEEGDRQHCCPHVAPGGERVAYLSLPHGQASYPEAGATGPLHTIAIGGTDDRILIPAARTYFEHRAVVWRTAGELIYIDGDGRTRLLDVEAGTSRPLTGQGAERHGWLVNSSLTHATTGRPSFSTYDAPSRRITEARILGGCQPYFSHDGRWGFWVAGAGGPIRSFDLATRRSGEILKKSDPRLPREQGYLYFPNLSHDSMLFTWAASPDQHEHATSNYDVFVAAVDPETLELTGAPWRVTSDPASDRFPDVYSAPLALGRHFGEAPLRIAFEAPDDDPGWRFDFGDGSAPAAGNPVEHTFERAGSYRVAADREGLHLLGFVRVRPARPPRVASTALQGEHTVVITFDEEVDLDAAKAVFESGLKVNRTTPGDDGRSLVLEIEQRLMDIETLVLSGVRDRAGRPNLMSPARLEIVPPSWPSDRRGLVFLWHTDDSLNQVEDRATGERRACLLAPRGRAWLDRNFAMELAGGTFVAGDETLLGVLHGCRRTNELTLEATLTAHRRPSAERGVTERVDRMARIITFSGGTRSRNLTLGQIGNRLVFRLRTATTGQNADRPQLDLGPITIGRPTHVVVTYTPGRLVAYIDGRQVLETDAVQDGFFHWKALPLVFGNEWQAPRPWYGALEGVAIYDRALGPREVGENHRRYAALRSESTAVPGVRLRVTLLRRSKTPTLEEISPYREALAVFEYRVDEILASGLAEPLSRGTAIRVAHRVLVDGEVLPVSGRPASRSYELTVEPFFDHPELESLYLSETLPSRDGVLLFSSGVER